LTSLPIGPPGIPAPGGDPTDDGGRDVAIHREPSRSSSGSRRLTGQRGEDIAATYLVSLGYRVIARNVRTRYGELDVVATEGETLVFVEVRTRRTTSLGTPEESVDERKLARISALADAYLQTLPVEPAACRIDVIAVELGPGGDARRVTLIRGAG
jgi:putative endonuclease